MSVCRVHDDTEGPAQHLQQRPAGIKAYLCVRSLHRKDIFLDIFTFNFFCPSVCAIVNLLQEDKEAMFDCYDTVHAVLQVTTGVMSTLKVRDLSHC